MERLFVSLVIAFALVVPIHAQEPPDDTDPAQPRAPEATPRSVQELSRQIREADPTTRLAAVRHLGEIDGPEAIQSLIEALKDRTPEVRASAARALGQIGGEKAVQPLIGVLRDEYSSVRECAAKALDALNWRPQSDPERVMYLIAKGDQQELVKMGPPAIDLLIEALADKKVWVRECAVRALGHMNDKKAVQPLMGIMGDKHWFIRLDAAEALEALGWKPQTEDEEVTYLIAKQDWEALVETGPGAVGSLIRALGDIDAQVSRPAAKALDGLGWRPESDQEKVAYLIAKDDQQELVKMGPAAVDPLMERLVDERFWVRCFAANALGCIGSDKALQPLIRVLEDGNSFVRRSAAEALDALGWRPQTEHEKVTHLVAKEDWQDLVRMGAPAVQFLIELLSEKLSWGEAEAAARVLGQIGDKRAAEPLVRLLETGTVLCRREAAVALGRIGGEGAIQALTKALGDQDDSVRYVAANALGQIGRPASQRLTEALSDGNAWVREAAARSLGLMRDKEATPELIRLLDDQNSDVRRVTAWALGSIGDKGAVIPLVRTLKDGDDNVRRQAALALERMDERGYTKWRSERSTWKYALVVGIAALLGGLAWAGFHKKKSSKAPTLTVK